MNQKKGQHMASRFHNFDTPDYTGTKEQRLAKALKTLPKGATNRVVNLIAIDGPISTARVCYLCSVGNVSKVVINANKKLKSCGLKIINYPPDPRPLNQYGEITMVHMWELIDLEAL